MTGIPLQFAFCDKMVEIGTNLIVSQFDWRLVIMPGQAFDASDVASLRLF